MHDRGGAGMHRGVILWLALMFLSACRFESNTDLRPEMTNYSLTAALPAGEYLFQSPDQNAALMLDVNAERIEALYQFKGNDPQLINLIGLLGSDQLPEKTYVVMEDGRSGQEQEQKYNYYLFQFSDRHIEWLKPEFVRHISGVADLAQNAVDLSQSNGATFNLVPIEARNEVISRFVAWRQNRGNQTGAAVNSGTAAVRAEAEPTINGLRVGDGAYVQGFLEDHPSRIQEIDLANRRVKVKRYSDGISEWVAADKIISREESTMNDIGRGGVVVIGIICLISPETCKPKSQ